MAVSEYSRDGFLISTEGLKRLLLATRDAHELYRQYGGFQELRAPDLWMERSTFG